MAGGPCHRTARQVADLVGVRPRLRSGRGAVKAPDGRGFERVAAREFHGAHGADVLVERIGIVLVQFDIDVDHVGEGIARAVWVLRFSRPALQLPDSRLLFGAQYGRRRIVAAAACRADAAERQQRRPSKNAHRIPFYPRSPPSG